MKIPNLTESAIRQRSTEKTWARGLDYYNSNSVEQLIWRDGLVTAEVEGSSYEPYEVEIQCNDQGIASADCTCPYDWGGDCKHIIAVLLHMIHNQDEIEEKRSLEDLLTDLDREQLASLLTRIAGSYPQIISEIERFVSTAVTSEAVVDDLPAIDIDLLRRQIRGDLRSSLNTGHDQWGDSWYDSDLGSALDPALERARTFLDAGEARQALAVLAAATEAWEEGIDSMDEYVRESFEDVAEDFTSELGEAWAEAVLMADLSEEELDEWREELDELADTIFGGSSLEIAVTAAEHGWTYPPLVAAMQGGITEKGVWEDDPPHFADEFTRIRLRILAQRGQYQEYLNLAQAEGQFMLYLQLLVQQGQGEKATKEGIEYLVHPRSTLTLAETLAEYGETEKAFRLALHGLGLEEENGKAGLAAWLRDQARAHQQPDLAMKAARQAFAMQVDLANYLGVQQSAGAEWGDIKHRVLETVEQGESAVGKVDIYLHEKMYKQAIAVVDSASWFYDSDKVIEAVKEDYPDWAFRQCTRSAEAIMNAGRAKDYDVAASWLRRGRDILLAAGQKTKWTSYLDNVMEQHHRKYKLMPMLRALE